MSNCTHDCNQGRNCTCRATYYGPRVRTRTEPGSRDQDYEVVEELQSSHWVRVAAYGHMSNDYALTEARQMAQSLSRKYVGAK